MDLARGLARAGTVALLGVALTHGGPAGGAVIVTATQSGGDVVFSGSGTLNLTALTSVGGTGNLLAGIDFGRELLLGAAPMSFASVSFYGAAGQITAPGAFGSDLFTQPSLGSGSRFGIAVEAFSGQTAPAIVVPSGYVSGASLSATSTFTGKTFASLGIVPGTYVWSWGAGATADTLTLNIVPEPIALLHLAAATAALGALRRRRA
jgi:hypothetical protein